MLRFSPLLALVALSASGVRAAPEGDGKGDGKTPVRASPKATFKGKIRPGVGVQIAPKKLKKYRLVNGQMVEIPDRTNEPEAPQPTPTPRVATGRRLKISARLVVTNADDGFHPGLPPTADKRVELGGTILLGGRTAFVLMGKAAVAGQEFASLPLIPVTLRYNDPNLHFFKVSGKIEDFDSGSGSDTLWVSSENIDLIAILQSNREFRIRGDRNSENADLYIRVTDDGEIFN